MQNVFKMMKSKLAFIVFFLVSSALSAQTIGKYEKEIINFERADSIDPPKKQQVLFVGSSSIRLWADFLERFKDYAVINRGFGGAELSDITRYAQRIIIPYRPSKVFIYAGDNDFGRNRSAGEVFEKFMELYKLLTTELPTTRFYFISVKPSPKRLKFLSQMESFNQKVKNFIQEHSCNWVFIDVYHSMLEEDGSPKADLFRPDNIHLNNKGYDIWEKLIRMHM